MADTPHRPLYELSTQLEQDLLIGLSQISNEEDRANFFKDHLEQSISEIGQKRALEGNIFGVLSAALGRMEQQFPHMSAAEHLTFIRDLRDAVVRMTPVASVTRIEVQEDGQMAAEVGMYGPTPGDIERVVEDLNNLCS